MAGRADGTLMESALQRFSREGVFERARQIARILQDFGLNRDRIQAMRDASPIEIDSIVHDPFVASIRFDERSGDLNLVSI